VYQVERRSGLLFTLWFAQREWRKFSLVLIRSAAPDTSQPCLWPTGDAFPSQNEWSWTNLSSVLYVDQPVGTGFSQGLPNANVCILPHFRVASLQQFDVCIVALPERGRCRSATGRLHATIFRGFFGAEREAFLCCWCKCEYGSFMMTNSMFDVG
jgi:hypothetical protein